MVKMIIVEAAKNQGYQSIKLDVGILTGVKTIDSFDVNLCKEDWDNLKYLIDDIFAERTTKGYTYVTNPKPKKTEAVMHDKEELADIKHQKNHAISDELRKKIADYAETHTQLETAKYFNVGTGSVSRIKREKKSKTVLFGQAI